MLKRFISYFSTEPKPFSGKTTPATVGMPHAPGYPPSPNGISLIHTDCLLAAMRQTVGASFESLNEKIDTGAATCFTASASRARFAPALVPVPPNGIQPLPCVD